MVIPLKDWKEKVIGSGRLHASEPGAGHHAFYERKERQDSGEVVTGQVYPDMATRDAHGPHLWGVSWPATGSGGRLKVGGKAPSRSVAIERANLAMRSRQDSRMMAAVIDEPPEDA